MIVSPALIDGSSENIRQSGPEGITFSRVQPADILSPLASPAASWDQLWTSHLLPSQGWRTKEQRGSSIPPGSNIVPGESFLVSLEPLAAA